MRVLLAGFGDLANRMASTLVADGHQVSGLGRRQAAPLAGIAWISADVTRAQSLSPLIGQAWDVVVITLTPGERSEQAYRRVFVDGLDNLLVALREKAPGLVLFASSTSVYPQQAGEWVDEQSAVGGSGFAADCLSAAEALLAEFPALTVAVRFGGLYAASSRYLLRRLHSGVRFTSEPPQYSNRIHRHDAARVFLHLIELYRQGVALPPCLNAVDSAPAPLHEVGRWLCRQMNLPWDLPNAEMAPVRGGKRVSNQRLRELGFTFTYPDYRAGYGHILGSVAR
jgi:nucleoside-diphosphate-sugar epimerase